MTDLFHKFNEANLQLQCDALNLIKIKAVISAFVAKLFLYKQNIGQREFSQFPNLARFKKNDEDVLTYCQHLDALHSDFNQQFEDILKMNIPDWILDPFSSANIDEELMEVTTNDEFKFKFKDGYQQFWLQK